MKYYLGIDLGGTNVAFGLADENKKLILKHSIKTNSKRPYEEVIEDIATSILSFLKDNDISLEQIQNIGMGLPGIIDGETEILTVAPNLGWKNRDIKNDLSNLLGKSVSIANDADLAAYGELLDGCAREYNNVAMLTLGTGVGGGVVLDGHIFSGGDRSGLELGHLTLVAGGLTCACGNKGCLETYASSTALARMARENVSETSEMYTLCDGDLSKIDGKIIFTAAKNNDAAALKTLDIYLDYLAAACYTTIMAYRPDALIIGGGISVQDELLIKPLNVRTKKMLSAMGSIEKTPVIVATLGNDAGILGACFLNCV